ncbi:MAG: sialate O-acetylesterase [Bacteroidaceae bacterium]|nr:sialate O-acetylesterase [Bacteroidaceae bacterium]
MKQNYVKTIVLCTILSLVASPVWSARKKKTEVRPTRVACVGNSVTYGYGLRHRDRDAYPVRLQQMLDSAYGANRYEVGSFGHSGSTLLSKGHRPYVKTPEFRQAMDFKADWVVIHLGLNDTDPRNWPDWKEDFIPDYRALIDSFRTANPEARILICRMTPIFDRHPRFQSGTRDWHAQIQQAIGQVARGANVQLIDLYSPLHSRPDLFPDALHPNPEGAQILARTVYGALTGDYGGLRLPPVYASGMVLPRDEHLLIEGQANARQDVHAVLSKDGKVVEERDAFTRADGSWQIELPHMKAGGPYKLTFTSTPLDPKDYHLYYPDHYPFTLPNLTKAHPSQSPLPQGGAGGGLFVIDSLYFGDLWLASGQSNMELRVDQCNTLDQDLADAARLANRLHLFNMPARARTDAVEWDDSVLRYTNELRHMDFQGWHTASPEVVAKFSAVAFNFARVLCDSLEDIPIGIICNAVGGSTTESWIDRTTLEREFPNILNDWRNGDYGQPWARGRMTQNIAHALNKESAAYNPLQRHPYDPAYLFEAAVAPLGHLPIKGVLWYQGESNAHNVELHERLFRLLQQSWREHFRKPPVAPRWGASRENEMPPTGGLRGGFPSLPFYVVQLSSLPRPSWPAFRDSQRRLANELPDTWMAVSSDVGDAADVHYRTKRPVGERLALLALSHTYGHELVCEGPTLHSAVLGQNHTVSLRFDHADGLICTRGFELAGPDGLFHPATIQIEGDRIQLSSPDVQWPAAVRYGWSGFTDADLRNRQGLPASTFLTRIPLH